MSAGILILRYVWYKLFIWWSEGWGHVICSLSGCIIFYVISQDINVLSLSEMWLGTDTDQLTINELVLAG